MKRFLTTLPVNILKCFMGRMIIGHLAAMLLTVILVTSGLDWQYYQATRAPGLRSWMFPAALIGFLLPICLPLILLLVGLIGKNSKATLVAYAMAQAVFIGWLISSAYKAITGRAHPISGSNEALTHVFHFGFLQGRIFWGWPSSHTTIAFAMAVTLLALFPKQRVLSLVAMLYACYIGIAVSMTIHWLSDFAAGAIIGTVIGITVGKSFRLADSAVMSS